MITIQIDCSEGWYESNVFTDPHNCYLARALRSAGYTNVRNVCPHYANTSTVYINNIQYVTLEGSNSYAFDKAFENKEILTINLKEI